MRNLSIPIRLLLLLVTLTAIYFGVHSFTGPQGPVPTVAAEAAPARVPTAEAAELASAGPSAATSVPASFTYTPAAPVGGKLRGVVELGASGFNSFIVHTDAQHRWKLNKSEFDNSLIMENMASDDDIRRGLRAYIVKMLDYGVAGQDIHFVVSSGALKAANTQKIVKQLASMHYVVNTMTPTKEASLGLSVALPPPYVNKAFVVDIGSGSTEISWLAAGKPASVETHGSKYYEEGVDDITAAGEVKRMAEQVPASLRQTCFIIGGVPYEMAKQVRKGTERYTVLNAADAYQFETAKLKAGLNIYRTIAETTGCKQFIFDWDANFTIGYLLSLPQ